MELVACSGSNHGLFVRQILVAHGAPLFTENTLKQTPCDCAEKAYHSDIALYLESKMVFSVSYFYVIFSRVLPTTLSLTQ